MSKNLTEILKSGKLKDFDDCSYFEPAQIVPDFIRNKDIRDIIERLNPSMTLMTEEFNILKETTHTIFRCGIKAQIDYHIKEAILNHNINNYWETERQIAKAIHIYEYVQKNHPDTIPLNKENTYGLTLSYPK